MLVGLDPSELLAVLAIFVAGGMIKGAMGFGLPLATMSVLPLVIPVEAALAINAIVLPLTNVTQFLHERRMSETLRRFNPVVIGVVIGVPIGAVFVAFVNDSVLLIALGVFVVAFTGVSLVTPRLAVPEGRERGIGGVIGVLAGVVGALTTANGPLFVMYLVGLKVEREMFLSAISLFFIVSGVMISASFLAAGLFDMPRFLTALAAFPAALVGMYLGNALARRIPAERFRLAVLMVLCLLGANLVLRGIGTA
ncbi:hypothetical protein C2I36_08895 [Rhodobacteraceae bacterium WD3A24]|nr:hypothetical protein C2I36_08895 [Rhodobacteraceae bacterium WD3A24]